MPVPVPASAPGDMQLEPFNFKFRLPPKACQTPIIHSEHPEQSSGLKAQLQLQHRDEPSRPLTLRNHKLYHRGRQKKDHDGTTIRISK